MPWLDDSQESYYDDFWDGADDFDGGEWRRRPRVVKVVATVIAAAMIAAVIGSLLSAVL